MTEKPPAKAKKKKRDTTTEKTTGVELVAQEHGGALNSGGTPGNKGGAGGHVSAIRQYCRGSFAERVVILEQIADGEPLPMTKIVDGEVETMAVSATIKDRADAIDKLGKYGGVDKLALTVDEQPEREMTPERRLELWESLKRLKTLEEFEKLLVDAAKKQLVREE